jgi:hypothetical protein
MAAEVSIVEASWKEVSTGCGFPKGKPTPFGASLARCTRLMYIGPWQVSIPKNGFKRSGTVGWIL